jgi:sugar/nucleoside kinase (ribokinase family)
MFHSLWQKKKVDFLGIGDLVTDAFIELEDAWIEEDNPTHTKELCMRFGDKIPYKNVVVVPGVGNAMNAAVCASRLGLSSAVVTHIGDDNYGEEAVNSLSDECVDTEYIIKHKNKKSNYNFILRFKEERTILVHHNEYNYSLPKKMPEAKFVYLSSLAKNSLSYHLAILNYLKSHPNTKLAFQPGTFQIKLGKDTLKELYTHTYIFFCNKEEAQKILSSKEDNITFLLKEIGRLGPKVVVITDGPKGAYVYNGQDMWHGPMYPDPAPPVDRTGAGDSFSSTFVVALALGLDIETALLWAPVNSMSVVQKIGSRAGLLRQKEIKDWLQKAPEDYKPEKI